MLAVANHYKLHVAIARGNQSRGLQKIIDAFIGNNPTNLHDDLSILRNAVATPKSDRPLRICFDSRKLDSVIDHFKSIEWKQIERSHAIVTIVADADHFGKRR